MYSLCDIATDDRTSSHAIRYVLKNRKTGDPLFVVIFTLIPKDQLHEEQEKLENEVKGKDEGTGNADDGELD